ncbi:MAG TPA: DNA polymerase I [Clostridia bacterium]|nr:DNA polymerase I [Clostridia bacterium]
MPAKKSAKPAETAAVNATEPTSAEVRRKPVLPPDSGKGRVFLIDAMSFIFRAYHAMARQRPMSTKTGIPTSATYVFVNMLNKLRKDFAPEYIAAVFDVAAPTFRDEQAAAMPASRKFDKNKGEYVSVEYTGYKANRVSMPEDLSQQVPYIRRTLDAYRIPILEVSGFEADDVIGTLACKASEQSFAVYVVSSDKDMLQLVNEKVCVLNPPKDNLICDRIMVEELLGVVPERVVDVMALRGDTIDNIPGAPGIGDKGSIELIQRFGSLDNLLDRAEEVERKTYRESLLNNREMIILSKQLVTIDCGVEIEFKPEKMLAQQPDNESARKLFTELEFTTLVKEFLAEGVEIGETDYREAKSAEDVSRVLASRAPEANLAVAVDATVFAAPPVEAEAEESEDAENGTMPLIPKPVVVAPEPVISRRAAIAAEPGKSLAFSLTDEAISSAARAALRDEAIPKAVHDYKTALHSLEPLSIEIAGVQHDPMLYSYLLDPTYSSHALKDVALRRMNIKLAGDLAEAADVTLRLSHTLSEEVIEAGLQKVYDSIDLPLVPVLARMEDAGVKLDCQVLTAMSKRLELECDSKAREIFDRCGVKFNINSPKQLGDVLFNRLNLPKPIKYGKGKTVSTAVDVLEGLASVHEVPRMVLDYRQLSKLKSTYVDALPALCRPNTGRLHTSFNQAATSTGRLSSTNPNLQNIPIRSEVGREIRAAFVAESGNVLLAADYSQIELRLLAHFAEDPLLVEAFRRGDDIHSLTASKVFGVPPMMIDAEHRRRAKAVNFGIVYGLSPFGLSQQLGIDTKEAKRFIDAYFEKYAGVRTFLDNTLAQARKDGKVETLFGRVRPIPDILSKNANMRGFAERTAVNTPLQGTAADLIKLAMIRIDRELRGRKLKTRMLLQVHDELVFEVPEAELNEVRALVKERMENVQELRVPLLVEIGVGPNWRDMD